MDFLKFYFPLTVHIQHYLVLASDGEHSGQTIVSFTEWSPGFPAPAGPARVTTILLTPFPVLDMTPCDYSVTTGYTSPPPSPPSPEERWLGAGGIVL